MGKNTQTLMDIMKGCPLLLKPLCYNIRRSFGFLKKTIKVFSDQDLSDWQKFLDEESFKISDGSMEAVAILRGVNSDIELILIDANKICKTILTSKETEWTQS
jgi:hypothetical protein